MDLGKVVVRRRSLMHQEALSWLRRSSRHSSLFRGLRSLRMAFHFGPWQSLARSLIRWLRPPQQSVPMTVRGLVEVKDVAAAVHNLRQHSLHVAGSLPERWVSALTPITDRLPVDHYQLIHCLDEDIAQLARDPAILAVLRDYLGCEPVLLESTLMVTGSHSHYGHGSQNAFHLDYAGWESLNIFVYLTDVAAHSSAHEVARGSHREIGLRDALRGTIDDDEAKRRFGDRIQTVVGPAGTLFFENTEAFHRRLPSTERRVMLNLLYASHRGWLSQGRTSSQHLAWRANRYRQARLQAEKSGEKGLRSSFP